ncbi:MAG: nucleoid-associated protein [Cytophagaceae bacterium]
MPDFSKSRLTKLCIHKVGNKSKDESIILSEDYVKLDDERLTALLEKYYLKSFPKEEYHHFHHVSDPSMNTMAHFAETIFNDPDILLKQSKLIANYLFDKSTHAGIKSGELHIAYFSGCIVDDEEVNAIGIFKSENKSRFLKISPSSPSFDVRFDEGIDVHKLDKGCFIMNTEKESGYIVCIVDQTNKSGEAAFWKDDFLGVTPITDDFFHTQNYLKMCTGFVSERLKPEKELSRAEEIDLLHQSINFFQENENFSFEDFTQEVIKEPEIIDAFVDYKNSYQEEKNMVIADSFDISPVAIKSSKKFIKSVIKLDKNFHIYVHGNKDYIEKGFDEDKGLNYYKVFFENEE